MSLAPWFQDEPWRGDTYHEVWPYLGILPRLARRQSLQRVVLSIVEDLVFERLRDAWIRLLARNLGQADLVGVDEPVRLVASLETTILMRKK